MFTFLIGERKKWRKEKEAKGEVEGEGEGSQVIPSIGEDVDQWELSYIAGDSVNYYSFGKCRSYLVKLNKCVS